MELEGNTQHRIPISVRQPIRESPQFTFVFQSNKKQNLSRSTFKLPLFFAQHCDCQLYFFEYWAERRLPHLLSGSRLPEVVHFPLCASPPDMTDKPITDLSGHFMFVIPTTKMLNPNLCYRMFKPVITNHKRENDNLDGTNYVLRSLPYDETLKFDLSFN